MSKGLRLPREVWARVAWRTARHVTVAVLASVALCYFLLETFSQGIGIIGLLASIVAPLVLGGPMVFYMSLKQVELQLAYEKLEAAAARDSLTNCFNHGAFVETVTAGLTDPASPGGALLVVDADHFKSINDRFGHASGDTALKLIVSAIRGLVRSTDVVGRLGGEEFGIFLPGATLARAQETAEAVRHAVQFISFEAGEETCTLSVSIGGVVCEGPMPFGDLFRLADQRLYNVKANGRNNIDVVALPPHSSGPAAPASEPELVYRGQKVVRPV